MDQLIEIYKLEASALGHLTSAVQFGFIVGTLVFALLTIVDRFSPSKVFFISAILGAILNLGMLLDDNNLFSLIAIRSFIGFFLAGIYPVGMKIATDYFDKGLGKSLGFLVGALVLGTALPHLVKGVQLDFSWTFVIYATSALAAVGGFLMIILVPDGPYREQGKGIDLSAVRRVFENKKFKQAAFGYFGHMWELYSFWAFVPILLVQYAKTHSLDDINISLYAFFVIAIGGPSCFLAGYISERIGPKKTATIALALSGICCLIAPFSIHVASFTLFLLFLLIWGIVVIADSPMFSTLVAQNANADIKGTALTIVNCLGFAITIVSIQLLSILVLSNVGNWSYWILALGPLFGLMALHKS